MRRLTYLAAAALAVLALGAVSATAGNSGHQHSTGHQHPTAARSAKLTASDLRATLGQLFGEHAALAMNATNLGLTGSPSFKPTAAALDRNSVAISKAIGSIYGAPAGKAFLDGKFMWRDHIRFFVAYTVATAKHDKAGQNRAVANLKTYTVKFGDFLAGATGLPKLAVRNDLLGHVLELKTQLDQYAAKNYSAAAQTYQHAYAHMFMTADLVAGAIAKQKGLQ